MITVHHLNNSRSQRVLWLLEEIGAAYEVKRYQRDAATLRAPPELKAVHPLGKSPVVTDGESTIAETGAIIEYLLEQHGGGRLMPPAGSSERREYTYWLHYAEGSAMPPLLLKLVFTRLPGNAPALLRGLVRGISRRTMERFVDPLAAGHIDHWENRLASAEWFAGADFTAADIMMSFPLEAAASAYDLSERPAILRFLERIHTRPAYRAALQRGGPYDYAS